MYATTQESYPDFNYRVHIVDQERQFLFHLSVHDTK